MITTGLDVRNVRYLGMMIVIDPSNYDQSSNGHHWPVSAVWSEFEGLITIIIPKYLKHENAVSVRVSLPPAEPERAQDDDFLPLECCVHGTILVQERGD